MVKNRLYCTASRNRKLLLKTAIKNKNNVDLLPYNSTNIWVSLLVHRLIPQLILVINGFKRN